MTINKKENNNMPQSGDIYKVRIFFKGTSGKFKSRPVLILNSVGEDNYTIVEITSAPPKSTLGFFDLMKEEIKEWKSYGLDRKSYVKCKNVYVVEDLRLFQKFGTMKDTEEFEHIVNRIDECN